MTSAYYLDKRTSICCDPMGTSVITCDKHQETHACEFYSSHTMKRCRRIKKEGFSVCEMHYCLVHGSSCKAIGYLQHVDEGKFHNLNFACLSSLCDKEPVCSRLKAPNSNYCFMHK